MSDPSYIKLATATNEGGILYDPASGWGIFGRDVREFPTDPAIVSFVRRHLNFGRLVEATQQEYEAIHPVIVQPYVFGDEWIGTAAIFEAANPVLPAGAHSIESDTGKSKVGNGVDRYNDLPYDSSTQHVRFVEMALHTDLSEFPLSAPNPTVLGIFNAVINTGEDDTMNGIYMGTAPVETVDLEDPDTWSPMVKVAPLSAVSIIVAQSYMDDLAMLGLPGQWSKGAILTKRVVDVEGDDVSFNWDVVAEDMQGIPKRPVSESSGLFVPVCQTTGDEKDVSWVSVAELPGDGEGITPEAVQALIDASAELPAWPSYNADFLWLFASKDYTDGDDPNILAFEWRTQNDLPGAKTGAVFTPTTAVAVAASSYKNEGMEVDVSSGDFELVITESPGALLLGFDVVVFNEDASPHNFTITAYNGSVITEAIAAGTQQLFKVYVTGTTDEGDPVASVTAAKFGRATTLA